MRPVSVHTRAVSRLTRSAWLAATLALACGDDSTDPPRATAEVEGAARCELPRGGYTGTCNECLAASCCAPIETCKGRADCAAQLDCMLSCQEASDPSECSRACLATGRDPDYVAYDDCSFEDCRDTCWL
jgi:hypothetical protein